MRFLLIRPASRPCSACPPLHQHALAAKRSGHPFSLVCFSSGSIAYFQLAVKGFWPSVCDEDENALHSTPCAHHRCSSASHAPASQTSTTKPEGRSTPGECDVWMRWLHRRWPLYRGREDTRAVAEHARDRSTGQSSWLVIVCVGRCIFGQPAYYAMSDAGCQAF
jgi:hypothetical protein